MKVSLRTKKLFESKRLKEYIKRCCISKKWKAIYNISEIANLELGILVDSTGEYWIEWGETSLVEHNPPIGAKLPFKLWLHTHPNGPAYWSVIDQKSLLLFSKITEKAIVLGNDGYLEAIQKDIDCKNIWWNKDLTSTYFGLNWRYHFFTEWRDNSETVERIRRRTRRIRDLTRAREVFEETHPDFVFYVNNEKRREIK